MRIGLALSAAIAVAGLVAAAGQTASTDGWRDTNRPPLERAGALLAALTHDQKIQIALGNFAAVADLGVPKLNSSDGPDGIRAPGTTAFPAAQSLAASFDRRLARDYGQAVAAEARGKGFNVWLGPAMDIARTPLAGRQPENLGEDPFLAGHTAAEEVAGARAAHVIAVLKHYVVNNSEWQRIGFRTGTNPDTRGPAINAVLSPRTLRELYEAPFGIAVREGGAVAVMCSYNRINGLPSCENAEALSDLRRQYGFRGYIVPDFNFAVRDVLAATRAGVDLPALGGAGGRTPEMFTSGAITDERLDAIVRNTLFAMFDAGVFDTPLSAPAGDVSSAANRALATRIAESGTVLLKNDERVLPFSASIHSVAVIGPSGADAIFVSGGSAGVPMVAASTVTPFAAIAQRAGTRTKITKAQGSAGDVPATTVVPARVLSPSSGSGAGLLAEYWSNGNFSGAPVETHVDSTIDLTQAPAATGALWSARWRGTLEPPETGLYRFTLLSSGVAALTIDGRAIGPAYRETTQFLLGPRYPITATVQLTAGKTVSIELSYSSSASLFGQQVRLAWQTPSESLIAEAVEAARRSDAAVVFANNAQGEGMDRLSLTLPGDQDALIQAVARVNRRTVVVLNTGGAVTMPWLSDVAAVLQTWYAGQQFGPALAAVLFGDVDPGGRLPVTFPTTDAQGPAARSAAGGVNDAAASRYPGTDGTQRYDEGLLVGYRWYAARGGRPLFPFGFGLSYADFRLSGFSLRYDADARSAIATVDVRNVSSRAESTVVQLYLEGPDVARPPRALRGYEKVGLRSGESVRVTFRLGERELAFFDERRDAFVVTPGRYRVSIGTSSRDLHARESFEVR